ncbi:MAG: YtfJ family protein [Bdellovibrionota bacterium]
MLVILNSYVCVMGFLFVGLIYSVDLRADGKSEVGANLPLVEIKGENGGKIDGSGWDSGSIKGKVYSLFYVDPDEKDANLSLEKALKDGGFDRAKYGSIAVINLAATWKPNFIIEKVLADKQEEYPDTIYVKDRAGMLVKSWSLKNDAYNVLLFDKEGKLLFKQAGTLDEEGIKKYITLIKANI